MKRLRYLLYPLALVALVAAALAYYALATTGGARWALHRAMPEAAFGHLEGSLLGGLVVEAFRLKAAGTVISSSRFDLDLDLGVLPPRLIVRRLAAERLAVVLPEAGAENESAGSRDWPDLRLPLPAEIETLHIAGFVITGGPLAAPLAIETLSARADMDDRLRLAELSISGIAYAGQSANLGLTGTLDLAPPYAHTLELLVETAVSAENNGPAAALRMEAEGSLHAWRGRVTASPLWPAELVVQLDDPEHFLAGGQFETLPWHAELTLPSAAWPPAAAAYEVRDLRLTATGRGDVFQLTGTWHVGLPAPLVGNWQLQAAGAGGTLRLEKLAGETPAGGITMTGLYDFTTSQAAGEVRLDEFDPARLAPSLAPLGTYSGTLPLTWHNGSITLTGGRLGGDGGAELNLDGHYTADRTGAFGLTLTWRDLLWAADEARQAIRSPTGELKLAGDRAEYRLAGDFALRTGDLPAGRFAVEASGRGTDLTLDHLDGDWLAGRWLLEGNAHLAAPFIARAELRADKIDPGQLWPAWPGRLDGALAIAIESTAAGFAADLQLHHLGGELRGEALTGAGRIRYRAGRIETAGLKIKSGAAGLSLAPLPDAAGGKATTEQPPADPPASVWPLQPHRLVLELPEIQSWVPAWRGSLHATIESEAAPDPDLPALRWRITARDGVYRDLSAALVNGEGRCCAPFGLPGTGRLTIEDAAYRRQRVDRLVATWQTSGESRSFDFEAEHAGDRLAIRLGAGGGPLDRPLAGRLETLDLNHRDLGVWQLEKPAEWTLIPAAHRLQVAPCVVRIGTATTLCANADVAAGSQSLTVRLEALGTDLLAAVLHPWQISGAQLSGSAAWRHETGSPPELELNAALTPGRLEHRQFPGRAIALERFTLAANGGEADGYGAAFDAQTEIGGADGRLRLAAWPEAGAADSAALAGHLRLAIPDLAVVHRLAPALGIEGGRIEAAWDVGGTLASPELAGQLIVAGGAYTDPASGLALADLHLTLAGRSSRHLALDGRFKMGEGHGTIKGTLDPAEPRLDFALHGERLALLDGTAGRLLASPALEVGWQPRQVSVAGRIDLPEGELKPLTGEVVKPSPDVVIEGAEPAAKPAPIAIDGRLTIALGEHVRVRAPAARAALAGTLDLVWDGSRPMPRGEGRITLADGQIRAYGQTLELRRGRILFERGPADEPRLDIRAAREIFGDPLVREAGVEVTGTARRPVVRLYMEPPGDEENALAYLITGSNFDYGNGEGALTIGVYLMPRLWISYGIGLFETGDVTSARYQFSRHWSVRVVSGARDTGADLSWSIDR